MMGLMPMPRSYHNSYFSSHVWLPKTPNVSLWQPATVIATPGENAPRSYVLSTFRWCQLLDEEVDVMGRVIPDERLPAPQKAISVDVGAPLINWAPYLSKSDSPWALSSISNNNYNKVAQQCTHKSQPII